MNFGFIGVTSDYAKTISSTADRRLLLRGRLWPDIQGKLSGGRNERAV